MANVITSLRLCDTVDWPTYVESVSLVDHVLRRDPAGVYARMDFLSRDRLRQAVEELAERSGEAQMGVALKAVESARQSADAASIGDRSAHVGYHLIGRGRPDLEADLAYRPPLRARPRRVVMSYPTVSYLGAIVAATLAMLAGAVAYSSPVSAPLPLVLLAILLLWIPAADIAIATTQRLIARFIRPQRLPRLDLSESGVPADSRTMVIVPTMLTSAAGVEALVEHIEVLALGNGDPHIHFAILSDFADAASRETAEDGALLDIARAGVERLNAKFTPEAGDRFFLFHRDRQWNANERAWIGWERKRGKIEEFNRLLRGATDTSFSTQVGRLDLLPSVRYCITLDSDTRLPRDAARTLVGIIAHPLNRPLLDPEAGRVTDGYGILQPRVSVTMASAAGSLFARTYAGHTGVDPYTTAVSDAYQDLFGEGIFTGKGLLRRRRVHRGPRGPRAGERAPVARPLRRHLCADGARHRCRGGGRLPVERPRAHAPPAPVGPRRLADPRVAVPVRADARRPHPQPPADHLALEDLRQPAAEPSRAGHRRAAALRVDAGAGTPGRLDRRGRRRGRVSNRAPVARLAERTSRAEKRGASSRVRRSTICAPTRRA